MTTKNSVSVDVAPLELPAEALEAASVSNLLVCGPPMMEKFGLMLSLLAQGSDHLVVITTKHPAPEVFDAHRAVVGENGGGSIGIVDALDNTRSSVASSEREQVRVVGSPGNLTRIGIEFSDLLETVGDGGEGVGVGLQSLSPLIMAAGLQPVYRFLGAMAARIRRDGHRGIVVLDTPVGQHDVESLRHHFDAVIETEQAEDGGRQLRVSGSRVGPTDWTSY